MPFEDHKFIDIGNTVKQQYHDGALRIFESSHIVNAIVLTGESTVKALVETAASSDFPYDAERTLLIHTKMTIKGSSLLVHIHKLPSRLRSATWTS